MQLVFILEQVLNGLLAGSSYLLIALGLSLIFSLGGIVNLAHGAFYALGAYLMVEIGRRARLCTRLRHLAGARGPPGYGGRALPLPPLLPRRPDPQPARHLRPGHGGRADPAHRLGRLPDPLQDPELSLGPALRRRPDLSLLPPGDPGRDRPRRGLGLWLLLNKTAFGRIVRAGVQNPDMVGALGISLAPSWPPWSRSASGSQHLPVLPWPRSAASTRPWAPRSSRPPS